jgi:hypothetical protein
MSHIVLSFIVSSTLGVAAKQLIRDWKDREFADNHKAARDFLRQFARGNEKWTVATTRTHDKKRNIQLRFDNGILRKRFRFFRHRSGETIAPQWKPLCREDQGLGFEFLFETIPRLQHGLSLLKTPDLLGKKTPL